MASNMFDHIDRSRKHDEATRQRMRIIELLEQILKALATLGARS